jgi:hypothetical protein
LNFRSTLTKLALAAAIAVPTVASAEIVTFDFTSGGVFSGGSSTGSFGNSITFTGSDGSTTVTVTAFAMTQGTTGFLNLGAPYAITSAAVTRTGNGLGVCNRAENATALTNTCNSLTGAGGADNLGFDEFLLFSFNRPVDTTRIGLTPAQNLPNPLALADSDAAIYQFNGAISPIGQLFPSLAIGPKTVSPSNPTALPRDITDANPSQFNFLILAADPADTGLAEDDLFRVGGLTANVPLPGTLALLGIAALAAGAASRKRVQA